MKDCFFFVYDGKTMIEFYHQIKTVHIVCVLLSGMLFFARGVGVLRTARWPMALPVRLMSYAIDTTLLTAALMLVVTLPSAMFANGWLTVKLTVLVIYIILGGFALKRAGTARIRAYCFIAAVMSYLCMLSIARRHHPIGIFSSLLG
jgi:uncharacterized membrane protein SirB2